jgi:AcrR family transcriptional regulator
MNIEYLIERVTKDLLKETSLHKLTIDMIVSEAEVSKTTFYRHYLDKYDMITRMMDNLIPPEFNQIGNNFSFKEIMFVVFDIMGKNRLFLIKIFSDLEESVEISKHNVKILTEYSNILIKNQGGDISDPLIVEAVKELAIYGNEYIKNWVRYGSKNTVENIVDLFINITPNNIYKYFKWES